MAAAVLTDAAFMHNELKLRPTPLPAMLYDCTHDNPAVAEKRDPVDALPNAALVAAAVCPVGSVRGYDILTPTNPSVVDEYRLYEPVLDSVEATTGGQGTVSVETPAKGAVKGILASSSASNLFNWAQDPSVGARPVSVIPSKSGSAVPVSFAPHLPGSSPSGSSAWMQDQHIPWAGRDTGIRAARRVLNTVRKEMAQNGFTQVTLYN